MTWTLLNALAMAVEMSHLKNVQPVEVRNAHPFFGQPADVQTLDYKTDKIKGKTIKLKRELNSPMLKAANQGHSRTIERNVNNLTYSGALFMGSGKKELRVMYDTGSSWLVINDVACGLECVGLKYDSAASLNFH